MPNEEGTVTPQNDGNGNPNPVTPETPQADPKEARIKELEATIGSLQRDLKDAKKTPEKTSKKQQEGFDEGQYAFLKGMGVDVMNDDEVQFVQDELEKSGSKSLRDLFKNPYFDAQLKARMEEAKANKATPERGRGAPSNSDSVDYNLEKYLRTGELPNDTDMREKVIQARIDKEMSAKNRMFNNDRPAGTPPGF